MISRISNKTPAGTIVGNTRYTRENRRKSCRASYYSWKIAQCYDSRWRHRHLSHIVYRKKPRPIIVRFKSWSSQNLNNENLNRIFQGAGIVYINENLARMRRELFANSQKFEFINHARGIVEDSNQNVEFWRVPTISLLYDKPLSGSIRCVFFQVLYCV